MAEFDLTLLTDGLRLAVVAILLFAALHDVVTRTVPNGVAIALAIATTALALSDDRLFWGLGFGATVFVICLLCWLRGWIGGADVKLLGAAAIIVAPADVGTFPLAVTLSGGLLALAYMFGPTILPRPAPKRPSGLIARILRVEAWRIHHRGPLPYACAIAAGTLFVLSS